MTDQEILHGPFNIETHKKTFIDYLEVIIRPDGIVEYAVPSHMYKLMSVFENGKYSFTHKIKPPRLKNERFFSVIIL